MTDVPGWLPEWTKIILSKPTASVQETGRCFGDGKNQAYKKAKTEWPTIGEGPKKRIPTAFIRRKLQLDGS